MKKAMKKAALVLLALFFGCGTVSGAAAKPVGFSNLARGTYAAGITEKVNDVFGDRASFEAFWELVAAGTTPAPALPVVDFTKDMAIAVSPGVMNSGGYTVQITNVTSDGEKLTVTVVVTRPTGIVTTALTQPYHIITIGKTDLPVEYTWIER